MKKTSRELNLIFPIAQEMIKDNGEDCLYCNVLGENFLIASFDGLGGAGAKKYMNYSGKTGAYVASRAVCGGVHTWFCDDRQEDTLCGYIDRSLKVLKGHAEKSARMLGSLSKEFPTTAAMIMGTRQENGDLALTSFWAGDSRCNMLDDGGLHQLSDDDLDNQDAMSNLTNDGVMTNVINATTSYEIHSKSLLADRPCILITASDGCFGYLKSPMEFEYLLIDTLVKAETVTDWKILLNERMFEVAGDDYTLCVAVYGYNDLKGIKAAYRDRCKFIFDNYINTDSDPEQLWNIYKKDYSVYLDH